MKKTLWITAIALALLSLTCFGFADVGTSPAHGTVLSTATFPVTIIVDAMAGVSFDDNTGVTLEMTGVGPWFSKEKNMYLSGNIPSDVAVALTTNNLPVGLELLVTPATTAQVSSLATDSTTNGDNAYVTLDQTLTTGNYVQSGCSMNAWISTTTTVNKPTGIQIPVLAYNAPPVTQPMIYSIGVSGGGAPPITPSIASTLTYTVTAR